MLQVAAAIIKRNGHVLICRRRAGSHADLWEFPGGKREPGETLEQCLMRECREELGIVIRVGGKFLETTHRYPGQEIAFTFYLAEMVSGEIQPMVHSEVRWVAPGELGNHVFCPADVAVAVALAKYGCT